MIAMNTSHHPIRVVDILNDLWFLIKECCVGIAIVAMLLYYVLLEDTPLVRWLDIAFYPISGFWRAFRRTEAQMNDRLESGAIAFTGVVSLMSASYGLITWMKIYMALGAMFLGAYVFFGYLDYKLRKRLH